ncbi:MAG: hypothetical protein TR69_WS6001000190 [candidate division WS6 bacterium OLB20]|uniref:Cohesin domain-containing protein n=1 Tax=candidate division WS6 bacterium OLB20 TaxID=1617426 RepID=A0A136M094_9BACT|nr:MAG: hypothetical protein TR69_WS6001000190 [candidate division WS6 bacterium OLB20]
MKRNYIVPFLSALLVLLPVYPVSAQEAPLVFTADAVTLDVGEEIEVPVSVPADLDTNVIELVFDYDEENVLIATLREGPGTLAIDKVLSGGRAEVTVAKTGSNFAAGDTVATLRIRLIGPAGSQVRFADGTAVAEQSVDVSSMQALTVTFAHEDKLDDTSAEEDRQADLFDRLRRLDPVLQVVIGAAVVAGLFFILILALFILRKRNE